jgi:hypothetical protein
MNRTIKDATAKRYFYETDDQLRTHLQNFVAAYNFARRLKTPEASPHTKLRMAKPFGPASSQSFTGASMILARVSPLADRPCALAAS